MARLEEFLKDGKWACNSCGACCSFIAPLVKNGGLPKEFLCVDGSCKYLMSNMRCRIYKKRPAICRVSKTLKPKYSDIEIAHMCKVMKDYQESL